MSDKIENELNLALQATNEERDKSLDLKVGFDQGNDTWQLIVLHDGSLEERRSQEPWITYQNEGLKIEFLTGNYAIFTCPEALIERIAAQPIIIFIEKPNRLQADVRNGIRASCISALLNPAEGRAYLSGKGILIGIIDSGIDASLPEFTFADGRSKIVSYWDQNRTDEGAFIAEENEDISGHGTGVASIAAQAAPDAELVVVKLGTPKGNAFPRTTELMRAMDFCLKESNRLQKPMAINVSFGNNYGGHDGESILETYMNSIASQGRLCICVGSGNEGLGQNHFETELEQGRREDCLLAVGPAMPALNLQIWKFYADELDIEIISPEGETTGGLQKVQRAVRYSAGDTSILVFYGSPKPYSQYQEIYIEFLPKKQYIDYGEWRIRLTPGKQKSGRIDMWLPSTGILGRRTGFLNPSPETTLTIPSTSNQVISVAAYDTATLSYAPFSGRGYTRFVNNYKPDLAAPGVNILVSAPGGGKSIVSGTSFATPFVTAAAAMLMQWGIVDGNDPYLYGEKVKAYLIKGAKELPGIKRYPNPLVGWGVLCVAESLPK